MELTAGLHISIVNNNLAINYGLHKHYVIWLYWMHVWHSGMYKCESGFWLVYDRIIIIIDSLVFSTTNKNNLANYMIE